MELSTRFRKPRWTDTRLLVGAVLVIAAVIGTYLVITTATATTRVWATAHSLVPGTVIDADDFVVAEVNLAELGERYLSADARLPEESSVRTVVAAGELIPASQIIPLSDLAGRVVSLDVPGSVPTGVESGSLVDVWVLPLSTGLKAADDPEVVVSATPVVEIDRDVGGFGTGDGARIEVFVGTGELPALLGALDGDSQLSVVTAPGAGGTA